MRMRNYFKVLTLLSLLMVIKSNASGQIFNAFGIATGINYGESVIKETFTSNGTNYKYVTDEADVAITWGVFARFKFTKFVFQPQLMASNYNTKMRLSAPAFDSILTLKQNRFDIPLLFGYAPTKHTRLLLGPVYTRVLENKVQTNDFLFKESKEIFKGGSWAMQMGFGFDMGRLAIDCKYETSLGKIADSAALKGYQFDFDHRNNTIQIMLGYDFIK
ncbi:MAG: hypothetical protein ACI9JN_002346 [Bacteroidia bacterium]|jgi:hypothetical protein